MTLRQKILLTIIGVMTILFVLLTLWISQDYTKWAQAEKRRYGSLAVSLFRNAVQQDRLRDDDQAIERLRRLFDQTPLFDEWVLLDMDRTVKAWSRPLKEEQDIYDKLPPEAQRHFEVVQEYADE